MAVIQREVPLPNELPVFKRMFLSFATQKEGLLRGYKTFVGGILISTVSIDANNGIFLIAVAIVEAKNKWSQSWFFKNFKLHFGEDNPQPWTTMSDRQKEILSTFEIQLSRSPVQEKGFFYHEQCPWQKAFSVFLQVDVVKSISFPPRSNPMVKRGNVCFY